MVGRRNSQTGAHMLNHYEVTRYTKTKDRLFLGMQIIPFIEKTSLKSISTIFLKKSLIHDHFIFHEAISQQQML